MSIESPKSKKPKEPNDVREYVLGKTDAEIALRSPSEFSDAANNMAEQAQQSIKLVTQQLDHHLFDNPDFAQALVRVANKSRYSQVMILLRDAAPAVREGHRLIELSQRFSSGIEVRRVSRDFSDRIDEYLIVDDNGMIFRANHERYRGVANYFDRSRLPQMLSDFKDQWENGTPEMQFRRLHL